MKVKSILLLALIAILCSGMMCECDDEPSEPTLPPETTTGENTFGCLVNGKVWRNGGVGFPNYSLAINEMSEVSLGIVAIRDNKKTQERFKIYFWETDIQNGVFSLDTNKVYIKYLLRNNDDIESIEYKKNIGYIEITRFDLINGIVSGRFEAILYSDSCDSIEVTQGRFDLKK